MLDLRFLRVFRKAIMLKLEFCLGSGVVVFQIVIFSTFLFMLISPMTTFIRSYCPKARNCLFIFFPKFSLENFFCFLAVAKFA